MKALVTGSTGFIGSHLAETLRREGQEVCCLVRPESRTGWLETQGMNLLPCDWCNGDALRSAVQGMDVVFHLAARIWGNDWNAMYRANTLYTKNLIEACTEANPGLKRFVFVSSIAASGPSERGELKKESDPCTPVSLYGKSKLLAEQIVMEYAEKIPVVIIRPPNVLGLRQREMTLILRLLKMRIVPMIGSKKTGTSLCFVEDLVRALILVAKDDRAIGQTYFVTDGKIYHLREILYFLARELDVYPAAIRIPHPVLWTIALLSEKISKRLNAESSVSREALKTARKYNWTYDSRKIKKELGFETRITYENGIRQILAACFQQGII